MDLNFSMARCQKKANTNKGWSTKPTHLRGDRVTTKGAAWEWGLCAPHWVSHGQGGGGPTNLNRYLGGHDLAQAHGGFVDAGRVDVVFNLLLNQLLHHILRDGERGYSRK